MQLHELYDLFGMTQLIKEPTRVTLDSSTLIDHIATTDCNNIAESRQVKDALGVKTCFRRSEKNVVDSSKCVCLVGYDDFGYD